MNDKNSLGIGSINKMIITIRVTVDFKEIMKSNIYKMKYIMTNTSFLVIARGRH